MSLLHSQRQENDVFDVADFLYGYICHRRDDFGLQMSHGGYRRQGKPLTYTDILAHVCGEKTLGIYQTAYPEETCSWIAYDIDNHDGKNMAGLQYRLLKQTLLENDVPCYTEHSGSPESRHVWVFLKEPTQLSIAYNFSRAVTLWHGRYVFSGEIFPKQSVLSEDKVFGNLIKLPCGVHKKNGNRSFFEGDMDDIETVDLNNWEPIELPSKKSTICKGEIITSEAMSDFKVRSKDVKPCIRKMIEQNIPLEHYDGHKLRIAIAAELHRSNWTNGQIVDVFRKQTDFDQAICEYQVESVRKYFRPKCTTIQLHSMSIQNETNFDIKTICATCPIHLAEIKNFS